MNRRGRRWRWWAAAIAAAIALWVSARTWRAHDAGSPVGRGTAAPGMRGSTSHAGAPPALPPGEDADAHAMANGDGAGSEPGRPAIQADVHRPPPPEAIGSPQPAAPPGQDTGLVFRAEPPGGAALEREKAAAATAPPGPSAPAFTAPTGDVRPPPEPIGAEPARPARKRDSGLMFSDQPQRPTDASDKR